LGLIAMSDMSTSQRSETTRSKKQDGEETWSYLALMKVNEQLEFARGMANPEEGEPQQPMFDGGTSDQQDETDTAELYEEAEDDDDGDWSMEVHLDETDEEEKQHTGN